jgi:hypothetical protein
MNGQKIIDGLRDAIAGNFARVTIEGQTWVREDDGTLCTAAEKTAILSELEEDNARLRDEINDLRRELRDAR